MVLKSHPARDCPFSERGVLVRTGVVRLLSLDVGIVINSAYVGIVINTAYDVHELAVWLTQEVLNIANRYGSVGM